MSKRIFLSRRLAALLILSLAIVCASTSAWPQDTDFLPVSEAFQPSIEREGDTLAVHWKIADGYYLYRHALRFAAGDDRGNGAFGEAEIPAGDKHTDEFFGEVETYRKSLTVTLPITDSAAAPKTLRVTYQGCADAGLCYPPQTKAFEVPADADADADPDSNASNIASQTPTAQTTPTPSNAESAASAGAAPESNFISEQDRIAGLLDNANLFLIVLSFLGLGVLLAFTPCVLPMIPILSGIVVGRGEQASAWRGFLLSSAYVLAMALAYTFFGVLAGLFGANLQALVQSPWTLVPFALVFVALALSMFGYYELQLPSSWQSRLNSVGRGRDSDVVSAAILGFVSALVVGPCLAPPLAGALLYIGASGNALLGGLALFALGLGMGLPLIALGTVGGSVLPRAGAWMDRIKHLFGVILLGVALWLLARILPGAVILALWSILLITYALQLGALDRLADEAGTARRPLRSAAILVFVFGLLQLIGAAGGASNPLRPLGIFAGGHANGSTSTAGTDAENPFKRVADKAALDAALASASRAGQPVVLDFYADWCVECVQMENTVFADPDVRDALDQVTALQLDVTAYDAGDRALMRDLNVFGPPTMLFYKPDGSEAAEQRVVGRIDADTLIRHIQRSSS